MIKLIKILIFCGIFFLLAKYFTDQEKAESREPVVDPALYSVVNEWKSDMQAAGIDYTRAFRRLHEIKISDLGDKLAGSCNRFSKKIIVSKVVVERGAYSLKGTLYHELGHYVFDLKHGSCEIMRSDAYPNSMYEKNWEEFKQEYLAACKANESEAKY
jgi:hypothetical protein